MAAEGARPKTAVCGAGHGAARFRGVRGPSGAPPFRGIGAWRNPPGPSVHFWISTFGIILYALSIYSAGLTQGLMWRAFDATGRLQFPDFIETTVKLIPMYWVRVLGGGLYLTGMVLFGYNILRTWMARPAVYEEPVIQAAPLAVEHGDDQTQAQGHYYRQPAQAAQTGPREADAFAADIRNHNPGGHFPRCRPTRRRFETGEIEPEDQGAERGCSPVE